jgi:hypothetical protein
MSFKKKEELRVADRLVDRLCHKEQIRLRHGELRLAQHDLALLVEDADLAVVAGTN